MAFYGVLLLALTRTVALDNGLGRLPLLGFNSWNSAQCAVTESFMRTTMDLFVSTGLRDAGYTTVSVDDCERSPKRAPTNAQPPAIKRYP